MAINQEILEPINLSDEIELNQETSRPASSISNQFNPEDFDLNLLTCVSTEGPDDQYIDPQNDNEIRVHEPEDDPDTWKLTEAERLTGNLTSPLFVDPRITDDQHEEKVVFQVPIVKDSHRRTNIKVMFTVICKGDVKLIQPKIWMRSHNFLVDVPRNYDFWIEPDYYEKIVHLSGQRLIRRFPMDLFNQAGITFESKSIGISYSVENIDQGKIFDYYVPVKSIPIHAVARPTPLFQMINGSETANLTVFWDIQYVEPYHPKTREDFNPDNLFIERIKHVVTLNSKTDPLTHLSNILGAYNAYVANLQLKERKDRILAPDLVVHIVPPDEYDRYKPPPGILHMKWTNDYKTEAHLMENGETIMKFKRNTYCLHDLQNQSQDESEVSQAENEHDSHAVSSPIKIRPTNLISGSVPAVLHNGYTGINGHHDDDEIESDFDNASINSTASVPIRNNTKRKRVKFRPIRPSDMPEHSEKCYGTHRDAIETHIRKSSHDRIVQEINMRNAKEANRIFVKKYEGKHNPKPDPYFQNCKFSNRIAPHGPYLHSKDPKWQPTQKEGKIEIYHRVDDDPDDEQEEDKEKDMKTKKI